MPKKPIAQKDQLSHLWDEVIGENGGGIKDLAKGNNKDIGIIKLDVAEIKGTLTGHVETARPTTKTITLRRLLEAFVAIFAVGLILALIALYVGGKLTAEDIAHILAAWKGAP